jgi:hypothetical protein
MALLDLVPTIQSSNQGLIHPTLFSLVTLRRWLAVYHCHWQPQSQKIVQLRPGPSDYIKPIIFSEICFPQPHNHARQNARATMLLSPRFHSAMNLYPGFETPCGCGWRKRRGSLTRSPSRRTCEFFRNSPFPCVPYYFTFTLSHSIKPPVLYSSLHTRHGRAFVRTGRPHRSCFLPSVLYNTSSSTGHVVPATTTNSGQMSLINVVALDET